MAASSSMQMQKITDLSLFYQNGKAKFVNSLIGLNFADKTSANLDDIIALPKENKDKLKSLFSNLVEKNSISDKLTAAKPDFIKIARQGDNLFYSLDGKEYINISDKRVAKSIISQVDKTQKFLINTSRIKPNLKTDENEIYKNATTDIGKMSVKIHEKYRSKDPELSLWAIWVMESVNALKKINSFFKLDVDFPKINAIYSTTEISLGYLLAGAGVLDGIIETAKARVIKDIEGDWNGRHKIIRNTLAAIGGIFSILGAILSLTVLGVVASAIFVAVALYAMVKYTYFAIKSLNFRNKLNRYLKNDSDNCIKQLESGLRYLKSKVVVGEYECKKITDRVRKEYPNENSLKIKELAREKRPETWIAWLCSVKSTSSQGFCNSF